MAATFFVVPQWQGSVSSRAMRLADGALAIFGDLPAASTVLVDVPLGAGSDEGTAVHRLSSIVAVRDSLAIALQSATATPIVVGGDCGVELAAVTRAVQDGTTAVLWFDAHPDLNTAESSPSGAFGGMVLRTLLGDGAAALVPAQPLAADHLVLAGIRAVDDGEIAALDAVAHFGQADATAEAIAGALVSTGATSLYIHVDLDALDPAEFGGVSDPVPFGLSLAQLLSIIAAAKAALPLVGAGITGFAPASPEAAADDLSSILRIVGSLSS